MHQPGQQKQVELFVLLANEAKESAPVVAGLYHTAKEKFPNKNRALSSYMGILLEASQKVCL